FVLTGNGAALLTLGSPGTVLWTTAVSALAVAALAVATGGWLVSRAGWGERALCLLAALLLLYLEPAVIAAGAALLAVAVGFHLLTTRATRSTG
ncbi:MAG: C4-dicarboxylate ABC transporter permease, partial [Actinomycetes bacterium]